MSNLTEEQITNVQDIVQQDDTKIASYEDTIIVPDDWDEDTKSDFALIKEEKAQEAFIRAYKRLNEQRQDMAKQYSDIVEQFKPFDQVIKEKGLSYSDLIKNYIAWEKCFASDPQKAMEHLAQTYTVKLPATEQKDNDNKKPNEVTTLKQQVEKLQNDISEQKQSEYRKQIEDFKNAKNEDGALQYPHFDKVKHIMAQLIKGKLAVSLQDSYQKAIRLQDDIYNQQLETQIKQELEKAEQSRQEQISKAEKAVKNLNSDDLTSKFNNTSGDLSDFINIAMHEAQLQPLIF